MKKYVTMRQRQELRAKKRKKSAITLVVMAIFFVIGVFGIPKLINNQGIGNILQSNKDGSQSTVYEQPDNIPEYAGQDYVVLNKGVPNFNQWDIEHITGEYYSNLDKYGRCGTVYALLDRSMMPTEERGEIGSVKPSGWIQAKYEGIVLSNPPYLYNRCHLIAYALTGQNANEKNLITGTRYMNVASMLPWEEKVMKYLDCSDNHVLYRVTPYFIEKELVARGVEMEAYSVEDKGESLSFHVFVYNVQPGIEIDYRTGESRMK